MKRASGVLMPISTLYGPYSIGGFSRSALEFVDFLKDCGFTYWQVLPFCIPDAFHSPYKSYSAFAGNPYFIDLEDLYRQGLLSSAELEACRQETPYSCEYTRLERERFTVLKNAAARVSDHAPVLAFLRQHPQLEDFCLFMAYKAANDQKSWDEWDTTDYDPTILWTWQFIQFTFFRQWQKIKDYANQKGVLILGDLPFYVSYDSADVWAAKDQFQLDETGHPLAVAGVPPDYFSQDGQLWGNPLYDWSAMEENNFSWWQARLRHTFALFDGVRIDHFRALESYWSVDATAKTAREGKWVKGPGMKLIEHIRNLQGDRLVIAEDLGDITPAVQALVKKSGFPGMQVFQFAFLGDRESPHLPHNYPANSVAYTGTHDNNTLLGYIWELDEETRRTLLDYCGYTHPDWDAGYDNILRTLFQSHAGLLILPIQDLLGYGSDTRLNTPGTIDGNWQFRITKDQLNSIDRDKFRNWNLQYGR